MTIQARSLRPRDLILAQSESQAGKDPYWIRRPFFFWKKLSIIYTLFLINIEIFQLHRYSDKIFKKDMKNQIYGGVFNSDFANSFVHAGSLKNILV